MADNEDTSLRATLEAAINEDTEVDSSVEQSTSGTDVPEGAESSQAGDTEGKSPEAAAPESAKGGDAAASASDTPEVSAAPEHWKAEDKATFAALPKEGQDFLLRRHKEMEGDYTKNKQEIAENSKRYEPIEQVIAPFRQYAANVGMTDAQLVGEWANTQRQLLAGNGKQVLLGIAQQFGIDLTGDGEQQQQIDPQIQQLQQTVQSLQSNIGNFQQTTMEQQLDAFANQKDAEGNVLHPHFDAVIADMTVLAKATKARDEQPDIAKLYEQAVWMNPTVREQVLVSQREAEAKKAQQEAVLTKQEEQERVNKAKAASAYASGDGSAPAPTQDDSIRSIIEQQLTQGGRI